MLLLTTWSFGVRAGEAAWRLLRAGGQSIDAVEAVCIAAEDDPGVDSVGFGGLPDRDGQVTLDGCIMLSPRRCGSVCAVTATRHPVSLARRVMERTPHVMLAGAGADAFAAEQGLNVEGASLLSPKARAAWEKWRLDGIAPNQSMDRLVPPRPVDRGPASGGSLFSNSPGAGPGASTAFDPNRHHDTIGVLAIDAAGRLAGACSTSGTPYKLPGRVGDSPIIGHGLYVDDQVGGATATGAGELVMGVCGSFAAVEAMRRGASPLDAVAEVLARVLRSGPISDHHQVALIALSVDGRWAAGALRSGYKTTIFAQIEEDGGAAVDPEIVLLPASRA